MIFVGIKQRVASLVSNRILIIMTTNDIAAKCYFFLVKNLYPIVKNAERWAILRICQMLYLQHFSFLLASPIYCGLGFLL